MIPLLGVSKEHRARVDGRPYWQIEYVNGRIIHETDGTPWELLPKEGRARVRLQCPNGQVAVVGNDEGASWRLFQFKIGEARLSAGRDFRRVTAWVIGIVNDPKGACTLWMWDSEKGELVGPIMDTFPKLKIGGPVTETMDSVVLGVDLTLGFN